MGRNGRRETSFEKMIKMGKDKYQLTLEYAINQMRLDKYMDEAIDKVAESLTEELTQKPELKQASVDDGIATAVEEVEKDIPPSIQLPIVRTEELFPLLSFDVDEKDPAKVKPFEYQSLALDSFVKEGFGTVVMPTGSGKTILGAMIIKYYWLGNRASDQDDIRAVVLTPQITILNQWIDTFKKLGSDATAYYGESKEISELTVTTYQSATAHPEILDNFNAVVLDEVHHLYADEYQKLIEKLDNKYFVLGLTATAIKSEDPHYGLQNDTLPVVFELTPTGLAEYGRATIPAWISVSINPTARTSQAIEDINKIYKRIVSQYDNFWQMAQSAKSGKDVSARTGMKLFSYKSKLYSATHDKLIPAILTISNELERNPEAKIIVFTESGESANFIGSILGQMGNSVLVLLSEKGLKANEKKEELDKFRRGFYRVLVGVNMIIEGLDVPEMDVAFMVAMNKKSERRFTQKLGRILRYREGKNPKVYTMTFMRTEEAETMRGLMSQVLHKPEPDEIIKLSPYDITGARDRFKADLGIDLGKDETLELVTAYLSKTRFLAD